MRLPQDKMEKLINEAKEEVEQAIRRNYKNLRDHEVNREDATEIVGYGTHRALNNVYKFEGE